MTTISANAPMEEVCLDAPFKSQNTLYGKSVEKCRDKNSTKRWSTERWLKTMTEQENLEFKDFISISYRHPRKDIIDQYFDNAHIRKELSSRTNKRRRLTYSHHEGRNRSTKMDHK